MKSNLIIFLNSFGGVKEIEDSFVEFRQMLKDEGFNEEGLHSVSTAPAHVFQKFDSIKDKIRSVKKELESYGILNNESDFKAFDTYISRKLSKIEKKTPLNGNQE